MKTGISTGCLFKRAATEQAFDIIKSAGAECCGVYLQTFYEYRPEFAKQYAERAKEPEVISVRVAPHNYEFQLLSGERRTRGDGFYWLDQTMRSAKLWGAEKYIFRGAEQGDVNFAAERLREICNFCGEYGVTLCLENARGAVFNTPYIFRELKERCPQLTGALNLGEAYASGYPYQMYIEAMRGSIACVGLSDVDESGRVCLPGEGILDFAGIFARLKDAGFDGCAVIDGCGGDESALKKSVEFLKNLDCKL